MRLEGLESFEGSIILVSHDRFLLEKVCTSFIGMNQEGVLRKYISIKQWQDDVLPSLSRKKDVTKSIKKEKTTKKKLSYLEERELSQIEDKVIGLEDQISEIKSKLEKEAMGKDHKKINELAKILEGFEKKLDSLYKRWEELEILKKSFL